MRAANAYTTEVGSTKRASVRTYCKTSQFGDKMVSVQVETA